MDKSRAPGQVLSGGQIQGSRKGPISGDCILTVRHRITMVRECLNNTSVEERASCTTRLCITFSCNMFRTFHKCSVVSYHASSLPPFASSYYGLLQQKVTAAAGLLMDTQNVLTPGPVTAQNVLPKNCPAD